MTVAAQPPNHPSIRVLIVDDHKVVRLGLRAVLSDATNMSVVGESGTSSEAVVLAAELHPDVVLMDARLPDASGFSACRRIKENRPATRVIILTSYADDAFVLEAIDAGADGYLLKKADSNDLVSSIERVAEGGMILDPAVARRVIDRVRNEPIPASPARFADLSARELQVLELLSAGKTNREIADTLGLSEGTTRNYISTIFSKLGVSRRAQAATAYMKWITTRNQGRQSIS